MNWTDLKLRLRALLFRRRVEDELDEELQFHIDMTTRKNMAAGISAPDASRSARVEFGGAEQVKEECRDARGLQPIDTLFQDIRYAIRTFRRTPGFTLTVVATIALGLGLNTTLFTVFNAYVLRPIAVRDPYSLYQFSWTTKSGGGHFFTPRESQDLGAGSPAFSELLSYEIVFARTEGKTLLGHRVSGNYFSMLGIDAILGRPLLDQDASAAGFPVVILSYGAWKSKFGADPNIAGKTLEMLGSSYEVAGVARPGFNGIAQVPSDFWVPLPVSNVPGGPTSQNVIGRLRPGLTERQAAAAMLVRARQMTAERPEAQRVVAVELRSNATTMPINTESVAMFAPVVVAFVLVLLIACANVANMMLARSMARQREIGIRLSLGAGRFRLIRQLVTESLLLAVPAAIAGFAISQATIRWTERLLFATMPPMFSKLVRLIELDPDRRVFFFLLIASVFATLIFGLVPAIQTTRVGLTTVSRGDFAGRFRPSRLRSGLVVSQVTACVLLLICAGILLRASRKLAERDVGLATRGVMSLQLNQAVQSRILTYLASEPWLESAATAWRPPLSGALHQISISPDSETARVRAGYNFVSPEYFALLRIPVTRGRNFTPQEASGESAVVIVSEATARLLWPKQDPIGKSIRITPSEWRNDRGMKLPGFRIAQVIGVARDVISGTVWEGTDPTCLYFPTSATGPQNGSLLVRLKADSDAARRSLDALLERVVPAAILRVAPLEEFLALQIYPFRISFAISSFLGGLALLLTLSGIYGVLSYLVSQRTKEIGIRMALGATTAAVTRIVLWQSMRLTLAGTAMGLLLSLAVSRLFASQLEGINTFDRLAYLGGAAAVLAAAMAASYFPGRRAARIEPIHTLRHD